MLDWPNSLLVFFIRSYRKTQMNFLANAIVDWFQLGNEYIKSVYCHPVYLTYMLSTSCEMPGCMKHKL